MTVVQVQVPRSDKRRLERFYRVDVDGTSDDAIRAGLDALLADRAAHEINRKVKALEKRR
jgi:hypothetical protein